MPIIVPAGAVHTTMILTGQSYWKIKRRDGKEFSEFDTCFDLQHGTHSIDWAIDIVGSGDNKQIEELTLCTRVGNVTLSIAEPYTAFQLKRGTLDILTHSRILQAQIIGRLEDKETGRCTVCIWDVQEQKLYQDWQTYIGLPGLGRFDAWREGIVPIGSLSKEVVGLR